MITLVEATPEDEPIWLELYADTRREEIASFGWTEEQSKHFVHMQYNLQKQSYSQQYPDAQRLTIWRGDNRIGRLMYDESDQSIALIDISIFTPYRRQGIGSSLLRSLQQQAQSRRKSILLHVYAHNPARELYHRLGFAIIQDAYPYVAMQWRGTAADIMYTD